MNNQLLLQALKNKMSSTYTQYLCSDLVVKNGKEFVLFIDKKGHQVTVWYNKPKSEGGRGRFMVTVGDMPKTWEEKPVPKQFEDFMAGFFGNQPRLQYANTHSYRTLKQTIIRIQKSINTQ